jgi:dTDP-4-amino-4,6-dideoxygalactose transaminase
MDMFQLKWELQRVSNELKSLETEIADNNTKRLNLDIPLFKVAMNDTVSDAVSKTLTSGCVTQGPKVEEFESLLKTYFGHEHVLTLNSATSGLCLAIKLLNLEPGSEILTPALTCLATNMPILSAGMRIKWVDTSPDSCNMDLDDLERKISPTTRAKIVVHWGGTTVDLDRLNDISTRYNIPVIEDAAHAFGSTYNDKKIGTTGNITVFSFQAIKHLCCTDGGAICLPTKELYDRAKLIRWFGLDRTKRSLPGTDFRLESDVSEWGLKWHMNDLNATIGICNLPLAIQNIELGRANVEYYQKELSGLKHVSLFDIDPRVNPSYWIYTIRITGGKKQDFIRYMTERKIVVSQVHNRNDTHSCMSEFRSSLPQLDILEKEIVSIPSGWWLSDIDRARVVSAIREWNDSV